MATFDWIVVVTYLAGMLGLSFGIGRRLRSRSDYYLGGNTTAPLPIALSTMATQCSTNSLLGAPAFVAFSGGLLWLQYELAVPFAMVALMLVLMPVFRRLNLISVYGYLERRYGLGARLAMSVLFQFTRAFSTGVTVFGIALVLEFFMGVPFWAAILILGGFTVVYDVLGGIKAVIWSDVIQLAVLTGSIIAGLAIALNALGGWEVVFASVDPAAFRAIDFSANGISAVGPDGRILEDETFGFWPMLIGGFFLYVAYYGVDQTQIQRELSSRSVDDSRRSLFFGGLLRFPLVLLYCALGLVLAAYVTRHPELKEVMVKTGPNGQAAFDPNLLVPAFALEFFPVGLLGLLLAGLLAAAMSSLDSTINSLSALTMQDLILRLRRQPLGERKSFILAKALTVFWGSVCLLFAFFVDEVAATIIEAVNKIGSLINGPLLAVFLLGLLTRRANQGGVLLGLAIGFAGNLWLWVAAPQISWLWWNVIGFLVTGISGYLLSLFWTAPVEAKLAGNLVREVTTEDAGALRRWLPAYAVLFAYGLALLVLLAAGSHFLLGLAGS